MRYPSFLLFVLFCLSPLWLKAEAFFVFDFEDDADNSQWVCNVNKRGDDIPNKWRFGEKMGFASNSKGIYISCMPDTTKHAYKGDTCCFSVAYRKINLTPGNYYLSYNYLCFANDDEGVYVGYLDGTSDTLNSFCSAATMSLPPIVSGIQLKNKNATWQSCQETFSVSRNEGFLYIVWYNKVGNPTFPSGAVDNIEIFQGACIPPSNLAYDKEKNSLSWTGRSDYAFEVVVYNNYRYNSTSYTTSQTNFKLPKFQEEGMYYFYVRSIDTAQNLHSSWVYVSHFVWIKGMRCIEFFDLTADNSGAAKCFSNIETDSARCVNYDACMHDYAGQIDYGYDDPLSVHTIHYVQGETDPRTEGRLRTIPEGELASIRINGHWEKAGYHAACIEYDYPVIEGVSDVLVLKYAAVLENPDHHTHEQPRLRLQVLKGNEIVDPCAQGDFRAGHTDNWNSIKYKGGSNAGKDSIQWCDWTTIKVSLRNYIGNTLTIRLAAYDCEPSGHYGYGYFTLNCESGIMQNTTCGDFSIDHFEAPEGFNYRWYKPDQPDNILSTNQRFNIDLKDTNIYYVDIINKEKQECFYTLEADPNPKYPQALFAYEHQPAECLNTVNFTNLSTIIHINRDNRRVMKKETPIYTATWDFGDGSEKEQTHEAKFSHHYPPTGGKFTVKCYVEMDNGLCQDSMIQEIELPNITTPNAMSYETICEDSLIDSHGQVHHINLEKQFIDTVSDIPNQYGCISEKRIQYTLAKKYNKVYYDTICQYEPYYWEGNGRYYDSTVSLTEHYSTIEGCDSILSLNLFAYDALQVNIQNIADVCIDDPILSIPYELLSGELDSIKIHIPYSLLPYGFEQEIYAFANSENIHITIPQTMPADRYSVNIEFKNAHCRLTPHPLYFNVLYSSSIVMQKNGFIAIQNENYNGGNYVFDYYQWYRNGRLIQGADQSYIPVSDNDIDTVFEVLLSRKDIDDVIFTCPIIYNAGANRHSANETKKLIAPTVVHQGQPVKLFSEEEFVMFTPDGKQVLRHNNTPPATFNAPTTQGLYILLFHNGSSTKLIVY